MNPSFTLDDAIASAAHAGQIDNAGRPYIEHSLRVMRRVGGGHEQMAAVLHDVLEDTAATVEDLRAVSCPEPVITAIRIKCPDEPLKQPMARAAADPIARVVKRVDIADNSDPERLALLDPATVQRLSHEYADSIRPLNHPASPAIGMAYGH